MNIGEHCNFHLSQIHNVSLKHNPHLVRFPALSSNRLMPIVGVGCGHCAFPKKGIESGHASPPNSKAYVLRNASPFAVPRNAQCSISNRLRGKSRHCGLRRDPFCDRCKLLRFVPQIIAIMNIRLWIASCHSRVFDRERRLSRLRFLKAARPQSADILLV